MEFQAPNGTQALVLFQQEDGDNSEMAVPVSVTQFQLHQVAAQSDAFSQQTEVVMSNIYE